MGRTKIDAERKLKALRLHLVEGVTVKVISNETGLNYKSVQDLLNDFGLTPRMIRFKPKHDKEAIARRHVAVVEGAQLGKTYPELGDELGVKYVALRNWVVKNYPGLHPTLIANGDVRYRQKGTSSS